MSTADNATITLAAEIGKQCPNVAGETIARIAGKLVKTCASLRKNQTADQGWLIDKARTLAGELNGSFKIVQNMPIGHIDPNAQPQFWLELGGPHIEVKL